MKKLWTRDFTILTLGSVVSVFGNTLAGFSINLMVLDYSNSVFLFILYLVIFNLPKILAPIVAGPLLDNFSRRKTIYALDFTSATLFLSLFFILRSGYFNYLFFLVMSFILGTIDSIYLVAYESLYPVLVAEGNFRKAYSVSSFIMPLSAIMLPVATFLYERFGIVPIFLTSSAAFFIAALFDMQIRADETHLRGKQEKYGFSEFKESLIEGVNYIKGEKGLLVITSYFFISMFASSSNSLVLPFFKDNPALGVMLYTYVTGASVVGRFIGGAVQYRLDYPKEKKFAIAMIVYISIGFIEMWYLFTHVYIMAFLSFCVGLLGVTSYNIRVSTTQSYISDAKRARFNGAFLMIINAGMILGQLIAGALADYIPIRAVVVSYNAICMVATFGIMWRGRSHVKPIYNRTV
ncbi:MAG: MFS transporter [Oscillospiraceae bacterium]|nr:MFS transporter [Oscillospiraceae bacterium]